MATEVELTEKGKEQATQKKLLPLERRKKKKKKEFHKRKSEGDAVPMN